MKTENHCLWARKTEKRKADCCWRFHDRTIIMQGKANTPGTSVIPVDRNKLTYRVGSVSFSRRKIGHAHDNSAASENVAGARKPNVHAHFIFISKTVRGNQSDFFLPMTKIQVKRVSHKLSRRTIDAPSTGCFREPPAALRKVWFRSAKSNKGKLRG